MKKILVTGGAGFIGSHTVVELLEAGYEVVVMDNFINSKPECLRRIKEITGKDFKFYQTDMCDYDEVCKIFEECENIDAVIHFAGLKAVGESVLKPFEYYNNNLIGTLKLIEAMKKFGCKKFVFSSSATVYGEKAPVPYTEGFPIPASASSPYGTTKIMIEQMLIDICNADKDFGAVLLRYFNPIGAHESGLIGEDPNGIPNNLMPYIAQVAVGKLKQLGIFGNDYDTPDGTCVRDYIHVVDLAKGHLLALEYSLENTGAEEINLGNGKGSSVLEVVSAFEKATGKVINKKFAPRRAGDLACFFANTKKAEKLLKWTAKYDLEKMCLDSWNFTLKNPNGL